MIDSSRGKNEKNKIYPMNYTHYNSQFDMSYTLSHSLILVDSLHQNLFLSC